MEDIVYALFNSLPTVSPLKMTGLFTVDEQMMTGKTMDRGQWLAEANRLFSSPRPEHFTNYRHCDECAEHDQTLLDNDLDSLTMDHLGNPAWDPVCFCSVEAKLYLMPALIRLTLDTINDDAYIDQLLFHLAYDGPDNDLVKRCSVEQRQFICNLLQFLLENYTEQVDHLFCGDDLLSVYEIWQCD